MNPTDTLILGGVILTIVILIGLTIIIIVGIEMYYEPTQKNNQPTAPKSKSKQYPVWEKKTNPDGTYVYKVVGYSKTEPQTKYQPYQRTNILTPTEYQFWEKLYYKCSMYNIIICPKVRMEDIIVVDKYHQDREKLRNRIKSRHIDFILCDSKLRVLAGLELDDASHQSFKAQKADSFKDEVFNSLDIPLFRIKVEPSKYTEEIARVIAGLKSMNGVTETFKPNYQTGQQKIESIELKQP